jgi:hypothetical protein
MVGTKTKKNQTLKSTKSASKKQSKSSKKAISSSLGKTSRKTIQKEDTAQQASRKKINSSTLSTKTGKKSKDLSHTSSTVKSLKEVISNILQTRTTRQKLKHSLNISKAREMVSGEFKKPGRPKKAAQEKEKPRTIRASDTFIILAKELASKEGFNGAWQTWLKHLAWQKFEELA